ncbi:MAG TPA: hypothetical protein DC015_09895 [Aequorivita sp.]|nr:hypothetical protein [Aequorivita sp.]
MQKFTLVAIALFFIGNTFAQSIEKTWQFSEVKDQSGLSVLTINPEKDFLKLENGVFEYQVANDSLKSSGDYMFQDNLLVLFFNNPPDSIRRFHVEQVTDSTLSLSEKNYKYQLKTPSTENASALETVTKTSGIIPSQGFSIESLWRGVLGMISLLVIAFLFYFMAWKLVVAPAEIVRFSEIKKYRTSGLKEDLIEGYSKKITTFMEEEKGFMDSKLSLTSLAEKLEIPKQYISEILNIHMDTNFQDFVNGYRIDAFLERLNDPKYSNYSLLGIANDVGFSSKSNFYATFKKHKGITPTEYRKSLK